MERRIKRLPRIIVVQAAVEEYHGILRDGLEHQRDSHRRADGERETPLVKDHRFLIVHVRGVAPEGDHQAVEPVAGRRRSRKEHPDEGQVELIGRDDVGRELDGRRLDRLGVDLDRNHGRRRFELLEIVVVVQVGTFGREPVLDRVGDEETDHLVGRVTGGVHPGHDGPHRGPGDIIDRDVVLLERLQNTHMIEPLGTSPAQDNTHPLTACSDGQQHANRYQCEKSLHNRPYFAGNS